MLVKNINTTSTTSSYPYGFTPIGNKVVFSAYNGKTPGILYSSDGSKHGTKLLDSTATVRSQLHTQRSFTIFKGEAYFIDNDGYLWKTNGTSEGTSMLHLPAVVNVDSALVISLFASGDLLYILTYNYFSNMTSILRTDGSQPGTYLLKTDINSSYNPYPTIVGNTLYFSNIENNVGGELWRTDGTIAGTSIVKTFRNLYNAPLNLYNFKGRLIFAASTQDKFGMWTSDGTESGTVILKEVAVLSQPFAEAHGKLFFYALDLYGSTGYELYATDGTADGTKIIKDINVGNAPSNAFVYPSNLIGGDTVLYFAADDGINGGELWKSDGTFEGTTLVKDITPGSAGTNFNSAISIHDHLFFVIDYNTLWESDGTEINTHPVQDDDLVNATQIMYLCESNNKLYFSAYTYAAGNELYSGNISFNNNLSNIIARRYYDTVGENDLSTSLHLKLSPDPAQNNLQVYVSNLKQNTPSIISIFSSSGALVKTLRSNNLDHILQLDISFLSKGVYTIKVVNTGKTLNSHFVKL